MNHNVNILYAGYLKYKHCERVIQPQWGQTPEAEKHWTEKYGLIGRGVLLGVSLGFKSHHHVNYLSAS